MRKFIFFIWVLISIFTSNLVAAAPQLFNTELKGVSRDAMRNVLANTDVKTIREDNNYWVDKYNPNGVLQGASELNFAYTSAGKFAYAEYTFPAFVDTGKIIDVANLVASKYGKPSQRSGNTNLGDASFTWNFKNGMSIVVYRGWPDTTTYLRIKDGANLIKMNNEINAEKQRQLKQKAIQQQAAF